MIPTIAKFTIGMNTVLTLIVAVDVYKGHKQYKKKRSNK